MTTLSGAFIGSISSGTLLTEDLIDACYWLARNILQKLDNEETKELEIIMAQCDELEVDSDEYEENAQYVLEDFYDFFDSVAPENCYFGGSEGDPADVGYWLTTENCEECEFIGNCDAQCAF